MSFERWRAEGKCFLLFYNQRVEKNDAIQAKSRTRKAGKTLPPPQLEAAGQEVDERGGDALWIAALVGDEGGGSGLACLACLASALDPRCLRSRSALLPFAAACLAAAEPMGTSFMRCSPCMGVAGESCGGGGGGAAGGMEAGMREQRESHVHRHCHRAPARRPRVLHSACQICGLLRSLETAPGSPFPAVLLLCLGLGLCASSQGRSSGCNGRTADLVALLLLDADAGGRGRIFGAPAPAAAVAARGGQGAAPAREARENDLVPDLGAERRDAVGARLARRTGVLGRVCRGFWVPCKHRKNFASGVLKQGAGGGNGGNGGKVVAQQIHKR